MANSTLIKYDFSWGNPYFLLDVLSSMYVGGSSVNIHKMNYGPYDGNPYLIDKTHDVIKKTTGQQYKHIIITNGASGALNLILRNFKSNGGIEVFTTEYGYPSYDSFIDRAGLKRTKDLNKYPGHLKIGNCRSMRLIDSPENPKGTQFSIGNPDTDVWDSVYNSLIYTRTPYIIPKHRIMVGSYSKLLGVAGARIGFIATNDEMLHEALKKECKAEYTGVSKPGQELISHILQKIDLDLFMERGFQDLCYNKEEFTKIEYLFDGQPVNEVGMFYCAKIHPSAKRILDNVGVEYVMLDDETIRLSMGQTKQVVKDGIKTILKEDRK